MRCLKYIKIWLFTAAFFNAQDLLQAEPYAFTAVRPNANTHRADMESLLDYLQHDPALVAEIEQRGFVRIFVGAESAGKDTIKDEVEQILRAVGITRKIEVRQIEIPKVTSLDGQEVDESTLTSQELEEAESQREQAVAEDLASRRGVKRITGYISDTFRKYVKESYAKPTRAEVMTGAGSKAIPFVSSTAQFVANFAAHPGAAIGSITLSLALDTFHGIWVSTWLNFQDKLEKYNGTTFQTVFNWAYGQFWGIAFRTISYLGGIAQNSVASKEYILTTAITSVVGSVVGTRGYQGLNRLYELGVYSYQGRAVRQQWMRDFLYMIQSTQFNIGGEWNIPIFWGLWSFSQILDLYFMARSRIAEQRPGLVIVDPAILRRGSCFADLKAFGFGT